MVAEGAKYVVLVLALGMSQYTVQTRGLIHQFSR